MGNIIDLLQWPAMVVTVAGAWLVASKAERKRNVAFWILIVSNALWIVWGLHDHAYALIFLQLCLAGTNIRGAIKNDPNVRPGGLGKTSPAIERH